MSFTVTHSIGRAPTFSELQEWAKQFEVQINGNEQVGNFSHPKATGTYAFGQNGEIRGDFTGHHMLGIITGIYTFMTGTAEITITKRPIFMPEGTLRAKILEGLEVFCSKFPPAA